MNSFKQLTSSKCDLEEKLLEIMIVMSNSAQ